METKRGYGNKGLRTEKCVLATILAWYTSVEISACFLPRHMTAAYFLSNQDPKRFMHAGTTSRGLKLGVRVAMANRHLQSLFELFDRLRRRAVIQYSACQ
jgi:hypothetical protein